MAAYRVGDHVQYWSDTHAQWMPGVVQRVKEAGRSFDLDVKKGASPKKLRALGARGGSPGAGTPSVSRSLYSDTPTKSTPAFGDGGRPVQSPRKPAMPTVDEGDMTSKAGTVAVRRMMVDMQSSLHSLETQLILRSGFIAGCFHMWRCQVMFSKMEAATDEDFKKHHGDWERHMEHVKAHYEGRMSDAERRIEAHKNQLGAIYGAWVSGDQATLVERAFQGWTNVLVEAKVAGERRHGVVSAASKFIMQDEASMRHSVFTMWKVLVKNIKEGKDGISEFEKQLAQADKNKDRFKENMMKQSDKWYVNGQFKLKRAAFHGWKKRKQMKLVDGQITKWAGTETHHLKAMLFVQWHKIAAIAKHGKFKDEAGCTMDELKKAEAMLAKLSKKSKAVIEGMQASSGKSMAKNVMQVWYSHTKKFKEKQEVMGIMAMGNSRKMTMVVTFGSWRKYVQLEKEEKLVNGAAAEADKARDRYLKIMEGLSGHSMKQNVNGMLFLTWFIWKSHMKTIWEQRNGRLATMRFAESKLDNTDTGKKRNAFASWNTLVASRREMGDELAAVHGDRVKELEDQILHHTKGRDVLIQKIGIKFGNKKDLKKHLFTAWYMIVPAKNEVDQLEKDRENRVHDEIHIKELEAANAKRHAQRAKFSMGFLDGNDKARSKALKAQGFSAWTVYTKEATHDRMVKLEKKGVAQKFSKFYIDQKLASTSKGLLEMTCSAWHKYVQRTHKDRAHGSIHALNSEKADLEIQLATLYSQIENITETLRHEMKTKEELAAELVAAYRLAGSKHNFSPLPNTTTGSADFPHSLLSDSVSEQTVDDDFPGGHAGRRPGQVNIPVAKPRPGYPSAPPSTTSPSRAPLRQPLQEAPAPVSPTLRRKTPGNAPTDQGYSRYADPPSAPFPGMQHGMGGACAFGREERREKDAEFGMIQSFKSAGGSQADPMSPPQGWSYGAASAGRAGAGRGDGLFNTVDKNHDGVISRGEFRQAYETRVLSPGPRR